MKRYSVLFLVVVMLAFGASFSKVSAASSLTPTQINAIISLLQSFGADQATIANVQASLGGSASIVPPASSTANQSCYSFNKNLLYGDTGDDVVSLKKFLDREGFSVGGASQGGFDRSTQSAVIKFQEKYRSEILTPSGLTKGNGSVGPATRKKLNQLYGC